METVNKWWNSLHEFEKRKLALSYFTSDKLCFEEIEYLYAQQHESESIIDIDKVMIDKAIFHLNS